jgi:hypothetical protein
MALFGTWQNSVGKRLFQKQAAFFIFKHLLKDAIFTQFVARNFWIECRSQNDINILNACRIFNLKSNKNAVIAGLTRNPPK